MERRRRTEILIEGDPSLRARLAREVEATCSVNEIEEPRDALVMVRVRETAKKSLFHLGEMLVTESKVQIDGVVGLGIIAGDQPEAARELAVIDAAFNARLPMTHAWFDSLVAAEADLDQQRKNTAAAVAATRVDFESMDDS